MSKIFNPEGQYDHIAIMAPGPSLTKDQVDLVMSSGKFFTIAIGDAVRLNPFADLLYHCDARWWNHYNGWPEFYGCQRLSLEATPEHENVKQVLKSTLRTGIDRVAPYVVAGSNSGYQAINLAYHYKPKQIILLGYNMSRSKDGRYNINGEHPPELSGKGSFKKFAEKVDSLHEVLAREGVKVYNCTLDSALKAFPRRNLKDVIPT